METYKIAHFGILKKEELDLEIIAIYNNDLEELKRLLGKKVNKIIQIKDEFGEDFTPLEMALYLNKKDIILYLIENNAKNKGKFHPKPIEIAVRYCSPEIVSLFKKDLDSLTDEKKEGLFENLFWGENNLDNIDTLEEMGITIAKYGGLVFRLLVSKNNIDMVKLFIRKGVDLNYHKPDMIFPYASTPIIEAARCNHFEIAKLLVENGADITIKDKYGDRPYTLAIQNENIEMAEYFKSLEPSDYHILQNKLIELKSFKLPQKLIEFLNINQFNYELEDTDFGMIKFFSLVETIVLKAGREKILRISKSTEDYNHLYIVYRLKTKKIAYYDIEHKELEDICDISEFLDKLVKID